MAQQEWPAGTYELLADRWDQRVSDLDKPFASARRVRGDEVELDAETADRLGRAGAIQKPGEAQRNAALAARAAYEAALAALPPELRDEMLGRKSPETVLDKVAGQAASSGDGPSDPAAITGDAAGAAEKPAKSAKQEAWVDYAVSRGAVREDAAKLGRDELVAKYGGESASNGS